MTVADLIREIRRPGRIEAPVTSTDDTFYFLVEKADLLATLGRLPAGDPAPWTLEVTHEDGTRCLTRIDRWADA